MKMIKARSDLVLNHPFFASLALRLTLREDTTCRNAWTDGNVLAYNPAYINALPLEKVRGVQCHEVLHCACLHHLRRGDRDTTLWNKACDYAINPLLIEAGVELPSGFLHDAAYEGKSADAIYRHLITRHEENKAGATDGADEDKETTQDIEGSGSSSGGTTQDDDASTSVGQDSDAHADSSSSASGTFSEEGNVAQEHGDGSGLIGEVRDAATNDNGDGDVESSMVEQDETSWRAALAQAVNASREAGDLPAGLERLVADILSPRLCWQELLRQFLDDAARNDFSWVRPNRRYLHAGLYLPGLHSRELSEIAVAVDVSGSITQPDLDAFAAELSAMLEAFESEMTVFTCDAQVTSQERLGRWDLPLNFRAKGGGGTSFRPPFDRLDQDGILPACVVYFTDLNSLGFPEEPPYPVLWVTANKDHTPPPFGEVVIMESSL
ncbi:vWA domain-containing protein [Desulfovibrio inopinatus]|uniref:vWA domain-containing protein n=1 Tax=Desulfovibrio inopinatus TaxID=102109 RepID=UPI0004215232|nr:VWA-like domain-containing protein [Desulfovibrio inopinatus]